MKSCASLSLAVGLAGLLLGLAAVAQAQYLVIGVNNKCTGMTLARWSLHRTRQGRSG